MCNVAEQVRSALESAGLRGVFGLPLALRRRVAGAPVRLDGQELALDAQLLLKMRRMTGQTGLSADTAELARAAMRHGAKLASGAPVDGVVVADRRIPADWGLMAARLYRPKEIVDPGPLLVFYHGGGWVIGDLDIYDDFCRFLAKHAGVRVLSVDYRLAPEHPFPAAFEDSVVAYRYAVDNAADLGTTREQIAVGGDSAGGNLAASVAQHAVRTGLAKPVFQLLIYPAVDATVRRRSRELFGDGLLLTDNDMTWFIDQYEPDESVRHDPRLSVLLAEDLTDLPAAYVVTSGFDPLRDEGEAYAQALADAGVPVVSRRFPDLIHGFVNLRSVGSRFQEALFEIVGTFRAGLELQRSVPARTR